MKTFNAALEAHKYSTSNPSETVECKSYYINGQLDMHRFYVGGKLHGEFKWYYNNGQLRDHSLYVNGLEHGECKLYWMNGQLEQHCFYINGSYHGEYKSYYHDGKLAYHHFFVNSDEINFDHLKDRSYKSLCIKHTLFDGNLFNEDI